ncbi:MAG TPA: PQQ-binding-like beta-propeller repeat protein [Actinomycetota bacterium]
MRARIALVLAAVAIASTAGMPAGAEVVPGCADPDHAGGDWPTYGHDLSNTRSQPNEDTIDASNVGSLGAAWVFNPSNHVLNGGGFSNTPIVADGCVYLATNTGYVFSLNADTGQMNWNRNFVGSGQTLLGGIIVGSPVVADGMVFVGVSRPGTPYVAALDQATGEVLWESTVTGWDADDGVGYDPATAQNNVLINSSAIYYNGMIFQGFAGNEGGSVARGGFAILDASRECTASTGIVCNAPGGSGGSILRHTYTIDDAEYAAGYRGASVWCTAAIDADTQQIYACGGNPASKKIEHRYSNALLKIDGDPASASFGEIVDAYKGNSDQYFPGLHRQPVCDNLGDDVVVVWSLACLQLDLDFGASPNLFTNAIGQTMVGALQKSGVYHTIFSDNMEQEWTQVVGGPCAACNAASTAFDPENGQIFMGATPVGQMVALEHQQGRYQWVSPLADGVHFHATSTANGVVYTMDGYGTLNAIDAATGIPMAKIPFMQYAGGPVSDTGSIGVAIARNTVYAAASEWVIAFRHPS